VLDEQEIWGNEDVKDAITKRCMSLCDSYFASDLYKRFKMRVTIIDNAIDGKFAAQNSFIADVAPLVIRKDYNATLAFMHKYFENDPIITLKSIGGTPQVNADIAQSLIQGNFEKTRFREKTWLPILDNLARYGTAVAYIVYDQSYGSGGTEVIPVSGWTSPFEEVDQGGSDAVVVKSIHPLNFFQDPCGNFQSETTYKGFYDTWTVADLYQLLDEEYEGIYNGNMVKEAIESCKRGAQAEHWYSGVSGNSDKVIEDSSLQIHPIRMYTMLNIKGNENDSRLYYVEIVHGKMIRCHATNYTMDTLPLQTGTYYPRPDMWMGNASLEFKMGYQNLKNWLIGTTIESTMKASDRMMLVRRGGGVDVADINNRHQNGGVVFYDGMEEPDKLIYQVQAQNAARQDVEWLNREINQEIQELSPVVNMQNKYNEGGMNNNTLGAAQMQAGIGETLYGFVMANISFFVSRIGEAVVSMMQHNFGDMIPYKESPAASEIMVSKAAILGKYKYIAYSSYYINERGERTDSANIITMALNWLGTGNQAFSQLNINEFLKDWLKAWKGSGSDIDKYLNQTMPQQQQVQQPTAQVQQPQQAGGAAQQIAQQPQALGGENV
jgi:hypothetical protein